MFPLLYKQADIENPPAVPEVRYSYIHQTLNESGGYRFLHGVSIEQYQGKLIATYGYNEGEENTVSEVLFGKISSDNGNTWTPAFQISEDGVCYANSHSVSCIKDDELFLFGPRFLGLGPAPYTGKGHRSIYFTALMLQYWKWNNSDGAFRDMGIIANADFWPISPPVRMANGNWIMSGVDTLWFACVAISHGDDFSRWDVVRVPRDEEVFTEPAIWIQGERVMLVMRNESLKSGDGWYHAVVSVSYDYGRTFPYPTASNIPMTTTKPFCGSLNDGRPYIIFNYSPKGPHDRGRLLLGIGEKEKLGIGCIYQLDQSPQSLSYPYAKQFGDKLYIVYSSSSDGAPRAGNLNDAKMAVVPVTSL